MDKYFLKRQRDALGKHGALREQKVGGAVRGAAHHQADHAAAAGGLQNVKPAQRLVADALREYCLHFTKAETQLVNFALEQDMTCLLYTSPSPRDS